MRAVGAGGTEAPRGPGGADGWATPPPGALVLEAGQVDIWRAPLIAGAQELTDLWGLLSSEERTRAGRLRAAPHRRGFVVARGTLRRILARYVGSDAAAIRLRAAPGGKPTVADDSDVQFNLAHSGGLALYAVAPDRPVGVDVEVVRPGIDCLEVARVLFTEREYSALRDLPEPGRRAAFFACWTAKESLLKATGEGLGRGLAGIEVTVRADQPPALVHGLGAAGDTGSWWVQALEVAPGYAAALAAEGEPPRLRHFDAQGGAPAP